MHNVIPNPTLSSAGERISDNAMFRDIRQYSLSCGVWLRQSLGITAFFHLALSEFWPMN